VRKGESRRKKNNDRGITERDRDREDPKGGGEAKPLAPNSLKKKKELLLGVNTGRGKMLTQFYLGHDSGKLRDPTGKGRPRKVT